MKISVITPSFNQAKFLPDNIRSVYLQAGVDVEHIIVDPGSTDGSTEIARRADNVMLICEPDRGQSHGITKGFSRASGDILVWLNSDDFYPNNGVLSRVAEAFEKNPDADIVYGNVSFVDETAQFLRRGFVNKDAQNLLNSFQYQVGIVQPGVFMRRRVFELVGGPSEDYHYCMDYEYWVRIARAGCKWIFLDEVLAHHRWWAGMKTASGRGDSLVEHFRVGSTYFGYIHHKWLDRYGEFLATGSDGVVNHAGSIDLSAKKACVRLGIERFVTQDMLALLDGAADKEKIASREYIYAMAPDLRRICFDTDQLVDIRQSHPDPAASSRVAWHIFDADSVGGAKYKTYSVPNNFSRSFDASWYYYQHERTKQKLARASARRKEVCVIVANGPSLNKCNLDLLEGADVIVSNYATLSPKLVRYATYLTIVNDLVAKQAAVQFNDLEIIKIVPFWLGNSMNATPTTFFIPATVEPKFFTEIDGNFSWRSTVSFLNMQLAFALGYQSVVLIGFDHSYRQAANASEGTAIVQGEEDVNHFDPRYFKGKTWQAADTQKMEMMYVLAWDAYRRAGRSIVNATVGGALEVFPRASLEDALGSASGRLARTTRRSTARFPKMLLLDMTAMGNGTATGELKANLLAEWPADCLLQVAERGGGRLSLVERDGAGYAARAVSAKEAERAITRFHPEAVFYRPVADAPTLHAFALQTIAKLRLPLAIWVMDDWPARMAACAPQDWVGMEPELLALLRQSVLRLSISESMSEAFVRRYGLPFVPLANGIDPADWPATAKLSAEDGVFRLRYAGGLAADMNRDSVLRVAIAVEQLVAAGHQIRFEISTQAWWLKQCEALFAPFSATTLTLADKGAAEYRRWLSEADSLLIAYNFDAESLRYIGFSLANKLPECLASGTAVLAHGPLAAATIAYLASSGTAQIVDQDSVEAIERGLLALLSAEPARQALAARGAKVAAERHNVHKLRERLRSLIEKALQAEPAGATPELEQLRQNYMALEAYVRRLELGQVGQRADQRIGNGGGPRTAVLRAATRALLNGAGDVEGIALLDAAIGTGADRIGGQDPLIRHAEAIRQFRADLGRAEPQPRQAS